MFGDTPLWLIEDDTRLREAADRLAQARVIGVDTESDSFHHYQEKVCLVQLSDPHTDYIVDPQAVTDLSPLAAVFADRGVVKVFHGADYDVVCLKRDFGFSIQNVFDTMIASQFLGLPRVGLADLIQRWFGQTLDKQWQRHDWAARPLLDAHLDYARGDSHWLPALRDVLTMRLRRAGRLDMVIEECAAVEGRAWAGRQHNPADFLRVKGSGRLDATGQRVLRALYRYRDGEARSMDRPAFKVIPDPVLLDLAEARPTTAADIAGRLRKGSALARRHGDALAAAVRAGLADESPLPEPAPRVPLPEGSLRGREAERLLAALKDWRNRTMQTRGLPAVAIVSNAQLRELTRVAPTDLDTLTAIPELRRWQVAQFGPELVEIVQAVVGSSAPSEPGAPRRGRRRRRRSAPSEGGPVEPAG